MTVLEKFQELANIKFVEYDGDIEIDTLQTADGYDLHYITADIHNLNFENEVYYYQPDFDAIMSAIDDLRSLVYTPKGTLGEIVTVACYELEDYFDEYYMLDFISDNMDEDEFEKFTNEK